MTTDYEAIKQSYVDWANKNGITLTMNRRNIPQNGEHKQIQYDAVIHGVNGVFATDFSTGVGRIEFVKRVSKNLTTSETIETTRNVPQNVSYDPDKNEFTVKDSPYKSSDGKTYRQVFNVNSQRGRELSGMKFGEVIRVKVPGIPDVFNCLRLDSQGLEYCRNYEEWARDYGYDEDSRKGEAVYNQCKRNASDLRRVIGESAYAELMTLESI